MQEIYGQLRRPSPLSPRLRVCPADWPLQCGKVKQHHLVLVQIYVFTGEGQYPSPTLSPNDTLLVGEMSCGTVQSGNCAKVGDYAPTHLKWKCIWNLISTQSSWSCLWMKRKMCPYLVLVYYVTCHYEGCRLSLKCWISALPFMWYSLQPDSCCNRNQMMCGGERKASSAFV